jgi:hypothetical protein
MRTRGQSILGGFLVVLGIILLLGVIFQINVWSIIWSAGLVAIGVLLLLRPRLAGPGHDVDFSIIGDVRRTGAWTVGNTEIWSGIGDVRLDFTTAVVPDGETKIHVFSLIGDIEVTVPPGVGLSVTASGLITELKDWNGKQSAFLGPLTYNTPDFVTAARRVKVETVGFINDVKIR